MSRHEFIFYDPDHKRVDYVQRPVSSYQGCMVDVDLGFFYGQCFDHPWEAEKYVLERLQPRSGIRGVVRWFVDGEFKDAYKV